MRAAFFVILIAIQFANTEIAQLLVKYAIIAAFGGIIRTLLSKESFRDTKYRMIAGVMLGLVLGFIMRDISWGETKKELFVLLTGAFAELTFTTMKSVYERYLNKEK